MSFKKGKQKTGGRSKGTPNAVTRDLREAVRELVEGNVERIRQDLEALEPKERVSAWLKLTEFVLPKLQRTETSATITAAPEVKHWIIELPVPAGGSDTSEEPAGGV